MCSCRASLVAYYQAGHPWGFEAVSLVGGRIVCYRAATSLAGTRRIQEDIELGRVVYFAYA
jgi:hypothetical protein